MKDLSVETRGLIDYIFWRLLLIILIIFVGAVLTGVAWRLRGRNRTGAS
jgi:hypothetical protein